MLEALKLLSAEAYVFLISMLPFFELRLSIPYGILTGLPWQETFFLAALGNFVPIIPMLFLFKKIMEILSKFSLTKWFCDFVDSKTHKNKGIVEKYGKYGLFIFVAIPLPGSGVYTGAAIAILLGMKRRDAFLALSLGMLAAGLIVTLASAGFFKIL